MDSAAKSANEVHKSLTVDEAMFCIITRNVKTYFSVCTRGGCSAGLALSFVKRGLAVADPAMSMILFLSPHKL